jgi:hypothetical protein
MKHYWLCLLLLCGCNAGRVFIASPGDYADYRRVRIAETYDARMSAAWHYLKTRPDGRYADRLRKYFDRAEPVFFAARSRNIAGLSAYLEALPDGPHARDALAALTAMKHDRRRRELDERMARASSMRLDADRKSRKAASELPLWWARALLDPRLWQKPISEAPPEFLVRWRLALPRPECTDDDPEPGERRCTKSVAVAYRVRGEGRRVERTIGLDVELVLDADWRLKRAMMSGKDVFVHAREGEADQLLDPAEARTRAAQRFVSVLTKKLFADALECNGGTDDKGVTTLECERVKITIEAGETGDDLFTLEPVAPPEPPAPTEPPPPPPAPPPP